jgi:hypothetical protein
LGRIEAEVTHPPGEILSAFWKQTSSNVRDRLEVYVIWKTEPSDGQGPGVIVDVTDISHGKDPTRRYEIDELSKRFEQILASAFGRENVIVEREPIGKWVF